MIASSQLIGASNALSTMRVHCRTTRRSFGATAFYVAHPVGHRFWRVNESNITSRQTGRGGEIARAVVTDDFASVVRVGPITLARKHSGPAFVWPRWLRAQKKTYIFVLEDGQVRLSTSHSA